MKRRMTSATLMVAVLLLGMFAVPASAQEVGETDNGTTAETCALAIATAYNNVEDSDAFEDELDAVLDDDGILTEDEDLLEELIASVSAFLAEQGVDDLFDLCDIYIGVLGDPPFEQEEEEEPTALEVQERAQPAEVLGVTLQRTGVDAVIIALIGAVLLGLGLVAVRRTRSESDAG